MSTYFPPDDKDVNANADNLDAIPNTDEGMPETGALVKEQDKEGMEMGTAFEEDREQDIDDLIHSQTGLKNNDVAPGES